MYLFIGIGTLLHSIPLFLMKTWGAAVGMAVAGITLIMAHFEIKDLKGGQDEQIYDGDNGDS